jgi:uncharacterized repeat protein (TIGR03803 family)
VSRNMREAASIVATAFCALAQATLTACGGDGNGSASPPPQTQVLHSFGTETPAIVSPSGLVLGTDGNFYGTALGGAYNGGVIFKITPAGVVTVLHSFDPSTGDGGEPGGLILGSDGNFYGTTMGGGTNGWGTVFKMTPDGTESVSYSFKGYPSDSAGASSVFQAGDGNLYGTSDFGGTNNKGTVFKVSPSGIETVLYSFGSMANDPAGVFGALVEGDDGNFYGVSQLGGTSNLGAVFQITPEGILTLVHSFTGGSNDGSVGVGSGLLKGSDGNFYGIASGYGPNGGGIVYKLTQAGVETIVHAFGSSTSGIGSFPEGTLSEDAYGNFYGGTGGGGYPRPVCGNQGCSNTGSSGTIFEISAAGGAVLWSNFGPSATDGTNPSGPPILGQDGTLYGVTTNGGADDAGVFYKITP